MSTSLRLPMPGGRMQTYIVSGSEPVTDAGGPLPRDAYAAAHVVGDRLAEPSPARLDWDATLAYRHHLWRHGLGVAEAMDTAQRGTGLDWPATRELIRRTGAEARASGGALLCGANTDQMAGPARDLDEVAAAYLEQCQVIDEAHAGIVLMASRHLAGLARGADDYAYVYGSVLGQLTEPAVLHWLGTPFDPALDGYWGSSDLDEAVRLVAQLVKDHANRISGIKVSLLDPDREIALRRQLPAGIRCYTGDDFAYPELIKGDKDGHSDALLGIFDAIAPIAGAALRRLGAGDDAGYDRLLAPTVTLSRHLFCAPTYNYKTGIVFLAWLAGHQDHFVMVGGLQGARSIPHLARLLVLADEAGLLPDAELAADRMRHLLAVAGAGA